MHKHRHTAKWHLPVNKQHTAAGHGSGSSAPPLTPTAYVPHALAARSKAAGTARTPDGCQVGCSRELKEPLSTAVWMKVAAGCGVFLTFHFAFNSRSLSVQNE